MNTKAEKSAAPDPFCGAVYRKGQNQPASCRLGKGHRGRHSDVRPSEAAMAAADDDDTAIGTVRPPRLELRTPDVEAHRVLPKVHRVKSWPEQFRAVITGRKRFEMRRDDRGYQPGDTIELQEFAPEMNQLELVRSHGVPGRLTGRTALYVIGYVSRGGPLPAGWCAFDLISVEDLNRLEGVRR